jgi:hypothetical protein
MRGGGNVWSECGWSGIPPRTRHPIKSLVPLNSRISREMAIVRCSKLVGFGLPRYGWPVVFRTVRIGADTGAAAG